MNLHEYQAKQLFAEFGLPVPEGARMWYCTRSFEAAGRISTEKKSLSVKYTLVAAVLWVA